MVGVFIVAIIILSVAGVKAIIGKVAGWERKHFRREKVVLLKSELG